MFKDLSLQWKLPMFLTGVLGMVVLALSLGAYEEVRRAEVEAAEERLRRVSEQLTALTSAGLPERLSEARAIAGLPESLGALRASDAEARATARAALRAALQAASPATAVATELRALDGRRIIGQGDLLAVPTTYAPADPSSEVLTPLLAVNGGLVYGATAPVLDGGEAVGTAMLWRTVQVDSAGRAALLDLIGVEGRLLLGNDGGPWTDLVSLVPAPPIEVPEDPGPVDDPEVLAYDAGDGPVYATITRMDPAPWYLAVEQPQDAALAGSAAFLLRLGLLVPLALVVVAASAWILGRALTRSIRATTVAAEAIASGLTCQRVDVRGRDEIGRLGLSFNTMAQQIEDSQRALEDLNQSLFTMLDGAPLPIIALDLGGAVRMWNRAAAGAFGWSASEVVGNPCPLIDQRGDPLGTGALEGSTGTEQRCAARNGDPLDLFVARAPTYAPSGEVDGHILVCEDITARKRAEEQLERYAEDLARSNAELEDFAYAASHDLQEPLRMVRSFTQLLAERYSGRLDEDADRFIDFAVDGATRMESLIRGLLEYSRVDGDPAELAPVASEEALAHALLHLGPTLSESGGTVTHDPLPSVLIDEAQLLRLFQNLVGNAVKFRGEEAPRVHVSARREGDHCVFSVSDNGIGIAPEYYDRIFVIFKRLHGRGQFEGTGMGLAICKKIVERNNGRIWVESVPGAGSIFYFSLPQAVALVA